MTGISKKKKKSRKKIPRKKNRKFSKKSNRKRKFSSRKISFKKFWKREENPCDGVIKRGTRINVNGVWYECGGWVGNKWGYRKIFEQEKPYSGPSIMRDSKY